MTAQGRIGFNTLGQICGRKSLLNALIVLYIFRGNVYTVNSQCSGSPLTINVGIISGSFSHPTSGQYGANENCEWLLTSGGAVILYRIINIAIDTSDGLSVYDGYNASATVIETNINTAGSVFSKPIDTSSGQNLFFNFTSDASAESNGFDVRYISSADKSSCSSSGASTALTATTSDQAITSPGFPGTYQLNWNCEWVVSPSDSAYYVTVDFQFLDNDLFNGVCYDKITVIYNDGSVQSAEPCGSDNFFPTNSYNASAGINITIKFESDGTQVERGFVAVYRQTAASTLKSTSVTNPMSTSQATTTPATTRTTITTTTSDATTTPTTTTATMNTSTSEAATTPTTTRATMTMSTSEAVTTPTTTRATMTMSTSEAVTTPTTTRATMTMSTSEAATPPTTTRFAKTISTSEGFKIKECTEIDSLRWVAIAAHVAVSVIFIIVFLCIIHFIRNKNILKRKSETTAAEESQREHPYVSNPVFEQFSDLEDRNLHKYTSLTNPRAFDDRHNMNAENIYDTVKN